MRTAVTGAADFVAGNTRLRARVSGVLAVAEAAAQGGERSVADVTAALRRTDLAGYLGDAGTSRLAGVEAVQRWRRDRLRGVVAVYQGAAAEVVAVALARYDLRDTITLLRGAARDAPDEEVLDAIDGVGAVSRSAAEHIVADDADAVPVRLRALNLPDPDTARAVVRAWEQYRLHDDIAELEREVTAAAARAWQARLEAVGAAGAPVAALIAQERQVGALVATVRGGTPDRAFVDTVPPARRRLFDEGMAAGGIAEATRRLDAAVLDDAAHLFRRGDPLSADIPVGYIALVEQAALDARQAIVRSSRAKDVA